MINKITKVINKSTTVIMIIHLVVSFLFPVYVRYNPQALGFKNRDLDVVLENHSVGGILSDGISPIYAFLFLATIVALLCLGFVYKNKDPKTLAIIKCGSMVLNLFFLFRMKSHYDEYSLFYSGNGIAFWYFLIVDILIIGSAIISFLQINKES